DQVTSILNSEDAILSFIERLLRADVPWDDWLTILDLMKPAVLGKTSTGRTLTIREAARINVRQKCIEVAKNEWRAGAEVVILGHTHLPQHCTSGHRRYYNPGSWTRYVESSQLAKLRLKDLEREDTYPFELNYIRVENSGTAALKSELICFERSIPQEVQL